MPPVFNFRTAEANPLITSLSLTTHVLCQDSKQFYAAASLSLIAFVALFRGSQRGFHEHSSIAVLTIASAITSAINQTEEV